MECARVYAPTCAAFLLNQAENLRRKVIDKSKLRLITRKGRGVKEMHHGCLVPWHLVFGLSQIAVAVFLRFVFFHVSPLKKRKRGQEALFKPCLVLMGESKFLLLVFCQKLIVMPLEDAGFRFGERTIREIWAVQELS